MRIAVDCRHHPVVHELDAGDTYAKLDHFNYSFHRILHRRKRSDSNGDRFRLGMEPQRHFCNDAERPLRSDKQMGKVVAGAGLAGACARMNDAAICKYDGKPEHIFAHRAIADSSSPRRPG